ncbi:TlpA family protein disulfide reductase [Niabella ginsengisoli]|uniref:Thioredoxin family protein n=1 Tax=Niabella ginsengisoli TaxID=522298 RepID=A0ABS9SKL4_9BACT|nr:thioredoxin family protein [Niabella ginsengisoli]MCH5598927.1 thioredoxin family protein [Niabella ginsengisoli]
MKTLHGNLSLNQIELGKPLPNWHLEKIFDEPELPNRVDYIGKPLVILFFNLGCPGCIGRAVPFANRLVYEYGDKINVLGIHTIFEGVEYDKQAFEKAKEELYIRFPFLKTLSSTQLT